MRILPIIMNTMDLPHSFSLKDRLLVLRFSHLGRVPPAQYETEILQEKGIQVVVVEFGNVTKGAGFVDAPLYKIRFPTQSGKGFPQKLKGAVAFLEAAGDLCLLVLKYSRPRLIVAHGLQEQCIAYFLKLIFKIPYAVHCHEAIEKHELTPFNRMLLALEGRVLRGAEFTIFPEITRQAIYRTRYRIDKDSFLVFNCARKRPVSIPFDLHTYLGIEKDAFLVGYMGGVGEVNALELPIEALKQNPKVHFILWGWGEASYVRSLKNRASELGVDDRVHFLGELDQKKWEMLSGLDASYCVYRQAVLRLRYAATASNKLFEAMAVGIPAIVGSGEDFTRFLKNAPIGYQLQELTAPHLAAIFEHCVNHPQEVKEKGALARRLHEDQFHFEAQFQKALRAFQGFFPQRFPMLTQKIESLS